VKKYFVILLVLLHFSSIQAYVGPGLGLGVIGTILGILVAIIMAIVGVFWYPIKRFFKKDDGSETIEDGSEVIEDVSETEEK